MRPNWESPIHGRAHARAQGARLPSRRSSAKASEPCDPAASAARSPARSCSAPLEARRSSEALRSVGRPVVRGRSDQELSELGACAAQGVRNFRVRAEIREDNFSHNTKCDARSAEEAWECHSLVLSGVSSLQDVDYGRSAHSAGRPVDRGWSGRSSLSSAHVFRGESETSAPGPESRRPHAFQKQASERVSERASKQQSKRPGANGNTDQIEDGP